MRFFADKDMWSDLLSRRKKDTDKQVSLHIGLDPIIFNLSLQKKGDKPPRAAKQTGQGPGVATAAERITEPNAQTAPPPPANGKNV